MQRRPGIPTLALAATLLPALLLALLAGPARAQDVDEQIAELREALAQLQQQAHTAPGREIYRVACATCHGYNGDGRGPHADGFAQRPTDFTKGAYKLRSALGDIPAPGDLERTIRVGMPGTEMVPFKHLLTEESIAAVAAYIRSFSPELSDPEARPDPDDLVEIPEERPFPRTEQTIAEGKDLYENFFDCVDCHGLDGRGMPDAEDDWGFPVVMLSFEEGYYKSGPRDADLYRTLATGMRGTSMFGYLPEAEEPEDLWKVVDYIRSLDRTRNQGFIARVLGFFFRDRPSGFDYSTY